MLKEMLRMAMEPAAAREVVVVVSALPYAGACAIPGTLPGSPDGRLRSRGRATMALGAWGAARRA